MIVMNFFFYIKPPPSSSSPSCSDPSASPLTSPHSTSSPPSIGHRELSIDSAVDLTLAKVDEHREAALLILSSPTSPIDSNNDNDFPGKLRSFCTRMDSDAFWDLVFSKRKEAELLRSKLPLALTDCNDPTKFVMDDISKVFPVDRWGVATKSPNDLCWTYVLILESLVPVLVDPELGMARPLVMRSVRKRARKMANTWKEALEQRRGIKSAKPPGTHAFLQHVVTFKVAVEEDMDFYRSTEGLWLALHGGGKCPSLPSPRVSRI